MYADVSDCRCGCASQEGQEAQQIQSRILRMVDKDDVSSDAMQGLIANATEWLSTKPPLLVSSTSA